MLSALQTIKYNGLEIQVKRDDMIDPFISGNKWRKLKYILQYAKKEKKDHLVTFGGAWSNHVLAVAAASARNGLRSTAFIRGEKVENELLVLCGLLGMRLIYTSREEYKEKRKLFQLGFGNDQNAFFIDEGGYSKEGAQGCSEIIQELPRDINHLFCAAGTGTTAAGLLSGIGENQSNTSLHIIPVLKGGEFINNAVAMLGAPLNALILHTEYHFGGYAKTTPELIKFIKDFTAETGLLIDPVYTGKMFYAIFDLHRNGYFQPGDKIAAIHTGGLLGILGMKEKFRGY